MSLEKFGRGLVIWPSSLLINENKKIEVFDEDLEFRVQVLIKLMGISRGVGIAAPQAGLNEQIFIAMINNMATEFINPEIIHREGEVHSNEGCLSIPNYRDTLIRSAEVVVAYNDRKGNRLTLEAKGMEAIVLQHETDHLNGKVFVDHLSTMKRAIAMRKISKFKKKFVRS